jgi:hypothetical protein
MAKARKLFRNDEIRFCMARCMYCIEHYLTDFNFAIYRQEHNFQANKFCLLRFEVFTAVTMKNCVFWDVTPGGFCKNRRFGGTWYFFTAYIGC